MASLQGPCALYLPVCLTYTSEILLSTMQYTLSMRRELGHRLTIESVSHSRHRAQYPGNNVKSAISSLTKMICDSVVWCSLDQDTHVLGGSAHVRHHSV